MLQACHYVCVDWAEETAVTKLLELGMVTWLHPIAQNESPRESGGIWGIYGNVESTWVELDYWLSLLEVLVCLFGWMLNASECFQGVWHFLHACTHFACSMRDRGDGWWYGYHLRFQLHRHLRWTKGGTKDVSHKKGTFTGLHDTLTRLGASRS